MFRQKFDTNVAIDGTGTLLQAFIEFARATFVVRHLVRNEDRLAVNIRFPRPLGGVLQVKLMTVKLILGPVLVFLRAVLFSRKLMAMTTP